MSVALPGLPEGVLAVRWQQTCMNREFVFVSGTIHRVPAGEVWDFCLVIEPSPGYAFVASPDGTGYRVVTAFPVAKTYRAEFVVSNSADEAALTQNVKLLPGFVSLTPVTK